MTALRVEDACPRISPEEYLAGEDEAAERHEYLDGYVYAMAGATAEHEYSALSLASALFAHFRGKTCQVFKGDMKLRLRFLWQDVFYYPDIIVTCDPADDHRLYKERPKLLVEVMSGNQRVDRIEKYSTYIRLPSLEEYVLIDPNPANKQVTIFRREDGWEPGEVVTSGEFTLRSVGLTLRVEDLYRP